ncbi:MAG: hypothetical protein M1839_007613 [Geoglossum umbratile]|nr:MAG: hypothetical protein M1839_007613 [Geoglossum umbratile]
MAMVGPRIVLGLDYGTTYTGLAWMQTTGQDNPTIKDLRVFRIWPGRDAPKVPSALSYSTTSSVRRCKQWGYSIDDNSLVMRWTKLELEPRKTDEELDVLRELVKGLDLVNELRANKDAAIMNEIPRHISKDSGDVVKDYLSRVTKEWYLFILGQGRHTLDQVPLDIVITHPASWSYEAMNKTFRAVVGAFPQGMFPTLRDISFTSEPEACALYTIQDLITNDRNPLIPGECFVVCDAGGGTVDLVSYRVESIEPFKLTKVGVITGGKYGATFIDQEFLEWLQPRLTNLDILPGDFGTGGHFVLNPRGKVLLDRFERVKHAFNGTNTGDITLPRKTIIAEGQQDDIRSGVIHLKETDLKKLFDKSIRGTVNLISKQVVQVQERTGGQVTYLKNIFLSGGFSENEYLFNEVKAFADRAVIDLQRAEDCWSGVVKGAVLRGMGIGMDVPARLRSCPRHYGICLSQIYADWRHDGAEAVADWFHGRQVVPRQLIWLVQRGDVILPDGPIVSTYSIDWKFTPKHLESGQSVQMTVAATALEIAPTNMSSLPRDQNEVVHLDIRLDTIPRSAIQRQNSPRGGGYYYKVAVDAEFRVSRSVTVNFICGGKILGTHTMDL